MVTLNHPPAGGETDLSVVPLTGVSEARNAAGFYRPEPGELTLADIPRELDGGVRLYAGVYATRLAMHPVGLFLPEGYTPGSETPKVVMTTPLYTSEKGHSEKVAGEIAALDNVVVLKGVPHYYGPTLRAVTQTQDANEIHGLLDKVEQTGMVGSTENVEVYGESQAAKKAWGLIAVAGSYGRRVEGGLILASSYTIRGIDLRHPWEVPLIGAQILKGVIHAAAESYRNGELEVLGDTLKIRDLHHHLIVPPVLVSDETARFLPHIDAQQALSVLLFGKDRTSQSYETQAYLESRFPNMDVEVLDEHDHISGIMSPEAAEARRQAFGNQDEETSGPLLRLLTSPKF